MYADSIEAFARVAERKIELLKSSPLGFFVSSMMAGAYVGIGIILIFVLGSQVPQEFQKLVMSATFGIALTLVVIAGAELFTGHNMYLVFSRLAGRSTAGELAAAWAVSWIGNLAGSVLLVLVFAAGGGAGMLDHADGLVQRTAAFKIGSPAFELVARAALCNWLVCLALWMSGRVAGDTAKCIVIWWCLAAFIACGFEHSVANMTLLSLALAGAHPDTVSLAGMAHNLVWVTLGNIIGGSVFVAGGYWIVSRSPRRSER